VIVPPVRDHKYVAPDVVWTLAVFPVEPAHTDEAAGVIVWAGVKWIGTLVFWPPALGTPQGEVTTQFNITALPVTAV
jgi:hypothetical protein